MAIPEGTKFIGKGWFQGSRVESVTIPASVTAIEADAFYSCRNLKRVVFAEGSKLEKIGSGCFCETRLEKISVPKSVREIQKYAFHLCERLEEVTFEEGSKLETLRLGTF